MEWPHETPRYLARNLAAALDLCFSSCFCGVDPVAELSAVDPVLHDVEEEVDDALAVVGLLADDVGECGRLPLRCWFCCLRAGIGHTCYYVGDSGSCQEVPFPPDPPPNLDGWRDGLPLRLWLCTLPGMGSRPRLLGGRLFAGMTEVGDLGPFPLSRAIASYLTLALTRSSAYPTPTGSGVPIRWNLALDLPRMNLDAIALFPYQGLSKIVTDEGDRLAPVQRPLTPVSSTGQALTLSREGERELWKGLVPLLTGRRAGHSIEP